MTGVLTGAVKMKYNSRDAVNGDPKVMFSPYRVPVHWYDRVFNDQMEAFTENIEEYEYSNAKKGWKEYKENFEEEFGCESLDFRWWEYEGRGREKGEKAPLIVILDEFYNTVWQRIADDEGLVLMASEYHRPQFYRPGTPRYGAREEEVEVYRRLIERMCEKYNIDRSRIYIFGLSYGDMTAYMMVRRYKELFAGAIFMNGTMRGASLLEYPLPDDLVLPTLHLRSDSDYNVDGFFDGLNFDAKGNKGWLKHIKARNVGLLRKQWIACSKTKIHPLISSDRDSFLLVYEGENVPMIYNELTGHSHIAPVSYAQVAWELICNVYRRNSDGTIEAMGDMPITYDKGAIGLAMGKRQAYIDHKVVELSAPSMILEPAENTPFEHILFAEENVNKESFYASVDILSKGFGIEYEVENVENNSVWTAETPDDRITLDDKIIHFNCGDDQYDVYVNCSFARKNGRFINLGRPALFVDGSLMIPVKEYAEMLGMYCSVNNGAAYITDHPAELGYTAAIILREEILEGEWIVLYEAKIETEGNGSAAAEGGGLIREGDSLTIHVKPGEEGRVEEFAPRINGLEVPYFDLGNNKYQVQNIFGDVTVKIIFGS